MGDDRRTSAMDALAMQEAQETQEMHAQGRKLLAAGPAGQGSLGGEGGLVRLT